MLIAHRSVYLLSLLSLIPVHMTIAHLQDFVSLLPCVRVLVKVQFLNISGSQASSHPEPINCALHLDAKAYRGATS